MRDKVIRASVVISALLLGGLLLLGRQVTLTDLQRHVDIANDAIFSDYLDLSKTGVFHWRIKQYQWRYAEGLARLSLIFDRNPSPGEEPFYKKEFSLKMSVSAKALATMGPWQNSKGLVAERLVLTAFHPTNQPMENKSNLWSGWHNEHMEYSLGTIARFPYEHLDISVTILSPDSILAAANPRLKIVGQYDGSVPGHLPLLLLIRDALIVAGLLGLAWIAILAWKRTGTSMKD